MQSRSRDLAVVLRPRYSATPTYRQLYEALREAILDGRLRPGVRLPSTRELGRRYALARGTIVAAFEHLKAEGYVTGRSGSGTYVANVLPEALLHARPFPRLRSASSRAARRLSDIARRAQPFHGSIVEPSRAFRANQPALDLFPTTVWAQIASRQLRRATTSLLKGCGTMGYPPLQRALADYLGMARGVVCAPEQVAIVSGTQEAIDLAIRLFVNPGDHVCMEDPGYIGASRAFTAAGALVSRVSLDEEGMKVPGTRDRDVRLAYVTPGHQFPVGTCMSLARRLALLEWARRTGAIILEDDYDSEFRFSGPPVPALAGLDRYGIVLFAGSFSKVLFPSIRIGYLVVPPDLVDRLAALKSLTTRHAPMPEQAIVCEFITEGHFGSHLRRMREVYAERSAALRRAAHEQLLDVLDIPIVEAGLQTPAWFRRKIDGPAAAAAAERRGLEVVPLSRFSSRPLPRDGLLLGFAAIDQHEIKRGMRELATALARVP